MRAVLILLLALGAWSSPSADPFREGVACSQTSPPPERPPPLLVGGLEGLSRRVEASASGSGRVRARVVVDERGRGETATLVAHTGPAPDSLLVRTLRDTRWQPGTTMGRPVRTVCTVAFRYGG